VELFTIPFLGIVKAGTESPTLCRGFCRDNATRPKEYRRMDCTTRYFIFLSRNSSNCFTIFTVLIFVLAKRCFEKILPLFSYVFHPIFIPAMAALFYLFFTDSEFTSQENYLCFSLWW
jgi:hypothetical protein